MKSGKNPEIVECCLTNGLTQLVSQPTHRDGSLLGLPLTTDPDLVTGLTVSTPPLISDHMAIMFQLRIQSEQVPHLPVRWNFRDMQEESIANHLDAVDWPTLFEECPDLGAMYRKFSACCMFLNEPVFHKRVCPTFKGESKHHPPAILH